MEYWQKIKHIEPEDLVFLDETGILLGLTRTHARSYPGTRVTELKPFYRAAKVTAIGAISINKVLALMTTLLLAKDQGLIPNVKDILDQLIAQGARISQRLYQETLAIANEQQKFNQLN